ncbi:hypothetical protein MCHI_000291 [Candidatus Magnetoovum chiemensis]|nr:hypothetical protein MCHI_000291 [Candidatus Magnetoovum chiemensis]
MAYITDNTKISELTVGDIKEIIRNTIDEELDDDYGLELNPDFVESIKKSIQDKKDGRVYTIEQVKEHLGIDSV